MSREEAMSLIEGIPYADNGFSHGRVKRTVMLFRAACNMALLNRRQRASITDRVANDMLWRSIRKGE